MSETVDFEQISSGDNSLSLILPSRNDVTHLNAIINTAFGARNDIQVILVDSGSEENCHHYMRTLVNSFIDQGLDITLVVTSSGIGNALSVGFRCSKHPAVAWFPTDGQLPLSALRELCCFTSRDGALIVVRENYEQISGVFRRALTGWNYFLISFMLGIKFRQFNGAFVMPTALVKSLPIEFRTAALNWAILHSATKSGLTIEEIITTVKKRDVGKSRITKAEFLRYPFEIAKYSWTLRSNSDRSSHI
jgi:hypothetical protein